MLRFVWSQRRDLLIVLVGRLRCAWLGEQEQHWAEGGHRWLSCRDTLWRTSLLCSYVSGSFPTPRNLGDLDMEAATQERLDAGDTIIIHAERRTDSWDNPVSRYQSLLQQHYAKKQIEALVVLSMVEDDRSWYHLVTRQGSVMSYAKNHPVPLVEGDIGAGVAKPKVAHVQLSSPISVTGSICFDTDFPYFTRSLSSADLLLETSAIWSNIGRQLRSHQFAAVENGQTLVKCTANGFTGAISPHGSSLYQAPQTTGVVSFMLPLYPKLGVFHRFSNALLGL